MSKEKDLKFIKDFSKITISGICKELGINRANVLIGTASEKNIKAVKERLKEKIEQFLEE